MTHFSTNLGSGAAVERRPAPAPVRKPGQSRPPATRASTDGCDGRRGRPLHTKAGCALFSAVSCLGLRFRSPTGEGLALQGEAQSGRGSPSPTTTTTRPLARHRCLGPHGETARAGSPWSSWAAPAPLPGNRVPRETVCLARPPIGLWNGASSDKPDRFGTTDVPASTMTGTLADPRDP